MMHAITHLNPVVGVDVHIVQPPGPVPPVPVPHPYVGIVFDPADYVPIIGSTISIHGLPRAIAGTAGKAVPSHIPIGGTFVKPPGNEDEDFMGSSTVAFDGDAATYAFLPCLSCHDVGSIAPPRLNPKKKTKMKSLVLPTSVVMPIPAGPPVLIGGPPTISLMALGMRIGMAGLGRGLRRLARTRLARRAMAAFRRARQRIFRNLRPGFLKCRILRAEPVDVVTGEVVVDQQDFSIPGRIPLEWTRHYRSSSERVGVCGYGWETPADARLEFEDDGTVVFHDGTGAPFYFPSVPEEEAPIMEPVDGGMLHRIEGHYVARLKGGKDYYFPIPTTLAEEILVSSIADLCGNLIRFVRDENGLRAIEESAGRVIEVESVNGLIRSMGLRHPDFPGLHPLVRFEYDESGNLICVYDALDAPYRFRYHYHRLIQHTDRNGLSFYYEYDEYSVDGRCVHTWGDGGLYDYRFQFHDLEGRTEFIDSLGHLWSVHYDHRYLITHEVDPLDGVTLYEYDDVGRTTAVADQSSNRTEYEYDKHGNVQVIIRPDGSIIKAEFNNLNKQTKLIDPRGNEWVKEWSCQGLLCKYQSPRGSLTKFFYNKQGDITAILDPMGNKTQFLLNKYGYLMQIINPCKHQTHFRVDALGNTISIHDSSGSQSSYRYDRKSRLVEYVSPAGNRITVRYDRNGNIAELRDAEGYVTKLEYSGRGEIAKRIQPDDTFIDYHYDTEERLVSVTNEKGETWRFFRDKLGNIAKEIDYWGNERSYTRDPTGNLRSKLDAHKRKVIFHYDALGQITGKVYPNGKEELFKYDPNGNMITAENEIIRVERVFDADNLMIKESQGDFLIENEYDLNGNRTCRSSSLKNSIRYQFDSVNNCVGITINDVPIVSICRDDQGRATEEILSEKLWRTSAYDRDGRLAKRTLSHRGVELIERQYEYDERGCLTKKCDSNKGASLFSYDEMERLKKWVYVGKNAEEYFYDPAGDLLKSKTKQARIGERTAEYRDITWVFDAVGNGVVRTDASNKTTFVWGEDNQLLQAVSESGRIVTMGYDALGRRVFKSVAGSLTQFNWDGHLLLTDKAEQTSPREFVFYPRSFLPFAIINADSGIYFFENDHIGLPHEILDGEGKIRWSGEYNALGYLDQCYVESINNPIRLQGQYYDEECELCYNGYRYFDARIGSFISQDPIRFEGVVNLYKYAPNVWKWVDPLGLMCDPSDIDEDKVLDALESLNEEFRYTFSQSHIYISRVRQKVAELMDGELIEEIITNEHDRIMGGHHGAVAKWIAGDSIDPIQEAGRMGEEIIDSWRDIRVLD